MVQSSSSRQGIIWKSQAVVRQPSNCHGTVRFVLYCAAYGTESIFCLVPTVNCSVIWFNRYLNIILFHSEVVLGEHRVDTDPDCSGDGKCSPPKITRGIKEIIVHESYDEKVAPKWLYDIALLRLDQEVTLNSEDPDNSYVMPVCLPWAKDSLYR